MLLSADYVPDRPSGNDEAMVEEHRFWTIERLPPWGKCARLIYHVTEVMLDYDDYQIGSGTTLFVTVDKERAERESHWDRTKWTIPPQPSGRRGRRCETLVLEDL